MNIVLNQSSSFLVNQNPSSVIIVFNCNFEACRADICVRNVSIDSSIIEYDMFGRHGARVAWTLKAESNSIGIGIISTFIHFEKAVYLE